MLNMAILYSQNVFWGEGSNWIKDRGQQIMQAACPPQQIYTHLATERMGLSTWRVTRPISIRLAQHQAAPCRTENLIWTNGTSFYDKNVLLLWTCL